MKRFHYFFILLFAILGLSFSQPVHAQLFSEYRLGIRGGLNLSTLNSEAVPERSARIGYHAGILVELYFNESVSLKPELLLVSRGGVNIYTLPTASDIVNAEGEAEVFLAYLDLPVPIKFTVANIISLHAGPYLGYLIDAGAFLDGDVMDAFAETPDRDDFKHWDVGLVTGIGLDMKDVTIGFRYCRGFSRVANSTAATQLLGDGKSSSLQGFITILL